MSTYELLFRNHSLGYGLTKEAADNLRDKLANRWHISTNSCDWLIRGYCEHGNRLDERLCTYCVHEDPPPFGLERQFCRKCLKSCIPAITKTWNNPTRRLHWCNNCAADSLNYLSVDVVS